MWFRLSQIILRYRYTVISIIAAITIVFGYYAFTSLKIDNQYGAMLPKDSPAQANYLRLQKMFGKDGGALVIAIQSDSLYTEKNFLAWKDLGDTIKHIPGVSSVFSEAELVTIHNNTKEHKFEIEPIFQDTTFQQKSIQEIKKEVRQVPLYNGLLYNDTSHVSLMLVNIKESYLSNQDKMDVVFEIESIAKEYQADFGHIRFSGLPHIRVVLGKRIVNEMYLFIGLAIMVTSIILYIFFRSFRVVFFSNIVVFTAVIWSLGSIGMMGFRVSILMALIPPLMIIIGIPNCVYMINNFHSEMLHHNHKMKGLSRIIHKIGYATFLTNLTTAIGFSTFIFTNSQKLTEFGISSTMNILFVFVLAITIIPIVLSFSGLPKERHLRHLDKDFSKRLAKRISNVSLFHRKWVYIIGLSVVGLAIWGATKMEATGNLTSDLPDDDPILLDLMFLQDNFKGVVPFEILVNYKEPSRMFDRGLLEKIETMQNNLAKDSLLSKSISIVNFMKVINMAYYGNNPYMYKLIKRRDMLRLKEYLANFQEDQIKKKKMARFTDSIRIGNTLYADSIMLNYPKIAGVVMQFEPVKDSLDSLHPLQLYPTKKQINNFIAKHNQSEKILHVSDKKYPQTTTGISIKELVDTAHTIYRIRMEIADLGSYQTQKEVHKVSKMLDTVLNPNYSQAITYLKHFKEGKTSYVDSIFALSNAYRNNVTHLLAEGNDSLSYQFDLHPELLASYYSKDNFEQLLKKSIEHEKLEYTVTGTAVVIAEGTQYLIHNLFTSIALAIIVISFLMATLFLDIKMVLISLIPNVIPQLVTAGIMGFFQIPIKPSTLLVFSIAFGISVDNTIHFLTKYKQELQVRGYDLKSCILNALYDTGISMYYTAIILTCGFSMFVFSKFGGTRALGLLISLTLAVAAMTNLFILPSILLSVEKRVSKKAQIEPLYNVYNEDLDVDISHLDISKTRIEKAEDTKDESPSKDKNDEN